MTDRQQRLHAQVVLRPGSGREITGESIITAETLPHFAPAPDDARLVGRALADGGFEVGPVLGIGMALSGERSRFEDFFQTAVDATDDGGWVAVDAAGTASRELPLTQLPAELRERVHAVSFEPPAEAVMGP